MLAYSIFNMKVFNECRTAGRYKYLCGSVIIARNFRITVLAFVDIRSFTA